MTNNPIRVKERVSVLLLGVLMMVSGGYLFNFGFANFVAKPELFFVAWGGGFGFVIGVMCIILTTDRNLWIKR